MMGRRGPGLVRVAATTAVVAGTAGAVSHRQQSKYAAQDQAAYDQQMAAQQAAPAAAAPAAPAEPDYAAELEQQIKAHAEGRDPEAHVYPHPIAFNALPEIDAFLENGYTKEEMKMTNEGRKIMGIPDLRVTCTTVRVPVLTAHSISINAQFEKKITREKARELIAKFPGCQVMDDPANNVYPMPLFAAGKDDCYVGRIREDDSAENCLNLWVCGDQLRKGAALNAVQIAEVLVQRGWLPKR